MCLQVNISREPSKSGFLPEQIAAAASAIADLPNLRLRGLMAIPKATEQSVQQRAPFAQLRDLLASLRPTHPTLDTLSMGMSADLEAAIHEGSTLVRIGTDIFGPRLAN